MAPRQASAEQSGSGRASRLTAREVGVIATTTRLAARRCSTRNNERGGREPRPIEGRDDRDSFYDGVNLTGGALSIDPGATLSLVFNAPLASGTSSTVDFTDSAFWGQDQSWTIIKHLGDATWNGSLFTSIDGGNNANNVSLATARPGACSAGTRIPQRPTASPVHACAAAILQEHGLVLKVPREPR